MTSLQIDLVRRKLALIARNLQDLAVVDGMPLDLYRSDRFRQKGTERLLQETVDAAVDANLHLLRASGAPAPQDYFQSFVALGTHGIVPRPLADRLAPAAGLRNRLVHEYDRIDDAIVLNAVRLARQEFASYVDALERYLQGQTRRAPDDAG